MVSLAEQFWAPSADVEPAALKRLNLLDWNEVHQHVQALLQEIDRRIFGSVPGVRVTAGCTRSRSSFALFSYRTYQTPDETIDPVVVGITFQPIPEGIRIMGEIAGELSGDVQFGSARSMYSTIMMPFSQWPPPRRMIW